MSIILQGNSGRFPIEQIVRFLATNGHSGTLELTARRKKAQITFDRGSAVFALADGLVVGDRAITGGAAVTELFFWDAGVFTFVAEANVPEDQPRTSIDLEAVLAEGATRSAGYREFRSLFAHDDIVLKVADDPTLGEGIRLSSIELRMLVKIGQGRSIVQLCADFRQSSLELFPMIRRLESLRLIERVSPSAVSRVSTSEITASEVEVPSAVKEAIAKITEEDETTRIRKKGRGERVSFAANATESGAEAVPAGAAPPAKQVASGRERGVGTAQAAGTLTSSNGTMFPLDGDKHDIGRDPSNGIAIKEASVSAFHARITRTGKGFQIEDVKSRNGTFVNGEPIREPRLLADADVIRIGKVILTFSQARMSRPGAKGLPRSARG